jgi:hypothetical protein
MRIAGPDEQRHHGGQQYGGKNQSSIVCLQYFIS